MAYKYKQVTCERDCSFSNFANGLMLYKYDMPNDVQINLSKSFFKMRFNLTRADGNPLEQNDLIAINYLAPYNLFRQMYYCCNGKQLSGLDKYVAQCGNITNRLDYHNSYRKSFMDATNAGDIDFDRRFNRFLLTGYNPNRSSETLQPFKFLLDNNNLAVVGTERLRTANGITIEYRDNGDVGPGAVDLTQTQLRINDQIVFPDGARRYIVNITPNTIIIDTRGVPNFNLLIGNNFQFIQQSGDPSQRLTTSEMCFSTPMGIMKKDAWLPAHKMEIKMYPEAEGIYQLKVIEALANVEPNQDYIFEVIDMIFYACIKDTPHESGSFEVEYDDINCHLTNITTTSTVDNQFWVNKNTHTLVLAFQDEDVDNIAQSSASILKIRNEEELNIRRYWIQYNGLTLPNPYEEIEYIIPGTNYLTQRYTESIYYTGSDNYQDVENYNDWIAAGIYFAHKFPQQPLRQERATVSTLFTPNAFENDHRPNILLFDIFKRKCNMSVSGGKVTDCKVND